MTHKTLTKISKDEQNQRAIELLQHGVRTVAIVDATGLKRKRVHELYKNVKGTRAPTGAPRTLVSYAKTWEGMQQVGLFVAGYQALYGDLIYKRDEQYDIWRRVCQAYANYIVAHQHTNQEKRPFDVNVAHEIAMGLIKKEIKFVACSAKECSFPSVVIAGQHKGMLCPMCQTPLRF